MNQEIVPYYGQKYALDDGMLFVRTEGILPIMAKMPILLAGIILVSVVIPIHNSFSSSKSLDLIIYSDGSTHISSEIEVDFLEPDFSVNLFGSSIDNFVAIGENDFLLSAQITGDTVIVETLGSTEISIDYDIHDLVSKEGRIWTFVLDSPVDYTVLMPQNSIIIGMNSLPLSMEIINEQIQLSLPTGFSEVNYVFETPTMTPTIPETEFDNSLILIGSAIAGAGVIGALFLRKSRKQESDQTTKDITETGKPLDPETIFRLKPDLRDDDKELINFIFNNGGKALESELRKKFLQPRTTMWRAVKRLERHGIVEIEKKEMQNVVKLKNELEDEQ